MRQAFGGGGFLGLTNTLRSLTAASPISTAVQEAHRMARQRLETGGPAVSAPKPAEADPVLTDFVLPLDVDADESRKAIEAKLRDGASLQPTDTPPVIERRAGGRVVVPAGHLLRLGDGRFDRGRQFMHGLVKQIRARRMRRLAKSR